MKCTDAGMASGNASVRFRDIIRRIRTLDYGSGSRSGYESCSFRQWLSRLCFSNFFWLMLSASTFSSVSIFKDKKSLRSHKIVEIKVFLTLFLLHDGRIWIRIRIREAQKRTDRTPDHWEIQYAIGIICCADPEIYRDYPRPSSLQCCARNILTLHRVTLTQ